MTTLDVLYSLLERMEASCLAQNEKEVRDEVRELVALDPTDVSSLKVIGVKIPMVLEAFPDFAGELYGIHTRCLEAESAVKDPSLSSLLQVLEKREELMKMYTDVILRESMRENSTALRQVLVKLCEASPMEMIEKCINLFKEDALKPKGERSQHLIHTYRLVCNASQKWVRKSGSEATVQMSAFVRKILSELKANAAEENIVVLVRLLRALFLLPSPTIREDITIMMIRIIDEYDSGKDAVSCFDLIQEAQGNPVVLATKTVGKANSIVTSVKADKDFCWLLSVALAIRHIGKRTENRNAVLASLYVLFCAIGRIIRERGSLGSIDMYGVYILSRIVNVASPAILYREYGGIKSWNGWVLKIAGSMFDTIQELSESSEEGFKYVSSLKSNDFENILNVMICCCRLAPVVDSLEQPTEEKTIIGFPKSKLELLAKYVAQFILPRKPDTILEMGKKEQAVEYNEEKYGKKYYFLTLSKIILDLIGEKPHLPERAKNNKRKLQKTRRDGSRPNAPTAKRTPDNSWGRSRGRREMGNRR